MPIVGEIPLVGIVGKPNSGKTTFWNAATAGNAKVAPIPFTTIEPNVGVGFVVRPCVCREFKVKCNPRSGLCVDGFRHIPVKLIDVAGLVPGAWKGRGLGNQFLDHLRRADVLLHIVDASGRFDAEGNDLGRYGAWDPLRDIEFLEEEIARWMWQILMRDWGRFARRVEAEKKRLEEELALRLSGLGITKAHVEEALKRADLDPEKPTKWGEEDLYRLARALREVAKPIVIVANKVDVPAARENVDRMREMGIDCVPCSALAEWILIKLVEKGAVRYIRGSDHFEVVDPNKLEPREKRALEIIEEVLDLYKGTGVTQAINKAVLEVAGMIVVYPVYDENKLTDHRGNVLPDALLVPRGTTAREFAAYIHSDLAKHFICAIDARTKRRLPANYVLKDNDVIRIVAAVR